MMAAFGCASGLLSVPLIWLANNEVADADEVKAHGADLRSSHEMEPKRKGRRRPLEQS